MARAKAKKSTIKARRRPAPKPVTKARGTARPKHRTAKATNASPAMRALARRIIDVTLGGDDEAMLALYAPDIESSEAGQPPEAGLDALRAKFAGWRSMTKDASFEPRRVCVDGNVIVIEWLGHVTLAASGRRVELHEVAIHQIENGKIVREAFYYNPAALGLA
jgi:ketosteroid isomerase-like protein